MKSSISAKRTISGKRSTASSLSRPATTLARMLFSLPVRSPWNPPPRSSKAPMRPCICRLPTVGLPMPPNNRSKVDFPAPFAPTIPIISPAATSKDTLRRAHKGSHRRVLHAKSARCKRLEVTGCEVKVFPKPSALTNAFITIPQQSCRFDSRRFGDQQTTTSSPPRAACPSRARPANSHATRHHAMIGSGPPSG